MRAWHHHLALLNIHEDWSRSLFRKMYGKIQKFIIYFLCGFYDFSTNFQDYFLNFGNFKAWNKFKIWSPKNGGTVSLNKGLIRLLLSMDRESSLWFKEVQTRLWDMKWRLYFASRSINQKYYSKSAVFYVFWPVGKIHFFFSIFFWIVKWFPW